MKFYEITLSETEIETLESAARVAFKSAVPDEKEKLKSVIGSIGLQKMSITRERNSEGD